MAFLAYGRLARLDRAAASRWLMKSSAELPAEVKALVRKSWTSTFKDAASAWCRRGSACNQVRM